MCELCIIQHLTPEQNGNHLTDDIFFKNILLKENVLVFIQVSLKLYPNDPILYISAFNRC